MTTTTTETGTEPAAEAGTAAEGGHHGAFPPLDAHTFGSQLLWLAIAFGLLYLLMSRVALPRVGSVLSERRGRIEGDLAKAQALKDETQGVVAAYEAELAAARKQAAAIAQKNRDSITAELDRERASAEEALGRKIAEAEKKIAAARQSALSGVTQVAAEVAGEIVREFAGSAATPAEIEAALAAAVKR